MSNIISQTPRLYLRELNPEDAENFYLLNLDPDVMRYTGDVAFNSIHEAKSFLENYDHYEKHEFGRWAVQRISDDVFLGWCGLKYSPELDEVDLGFRFFKSFWNQGFATEAASLCLELGFGKFELKRIVGRAMSENLASIRVLEKIGFEPCSSKPFEESYRMTVCDKIFEIFP
jgi:RimJ/RimL family protein N-acetyltransferase